MLAAPRLKVIPAFSMFFIQLFYSAFLPFYLAFLPYPTARLKTKVCTLKVGLYPFHLSFNSKSEPKLSNKQISYKVLKVVWKWQVFKLDFPHNTTYLSKNEAMK